VRQHPLTFVTIALALAGSVAGAANAAAQVFLIAGDAHYPPRDSLIEITRRDSLDPAAHYHLGLALMHDRRSDSAETAFRTAVRLDPHLAAGWLALSVVQDENRRYWDQLRHAGGDTAVARERAARVGYLRRALLLDPLVDLSVLLLYADRHRLGISRGMRVWSLDLYWMAGNEEEGQLERHGTPPDSFPPGLLWMHGSIAARGAKYDHAIRDLTLLVHWSAAHELSDSLRVVPLPTNDIRYVLAAVQQRAGHRTQALYLYQEVIENDVGNYMAHVQVARLHEDGAEWSQAVNSRRAAIAANPDDPTLLLDLAATLLNARRARTADSVLAEAATHLATTPRLYYLTGLTKQELTQYGDARAAYETFLRLAPSRYGPAVDDARARLAALPARP
jgi:tetratricopeptide (TPR) repeat protein